MKRTLLLTAAAFALLLSLTGCSSMDSADNNRRTETVVTEDQSYTADADGMTNERGDNGVVTNNGTTASERNANNNDTTNGNGTANGTANGTTNGTVNGTTNGTSQVGNGVRRAVDRAGEVVDDVADGAADIVDDATDVVTGDNDSRTRR